MTVLKVHIRRLFIKDDNYLSKFRVLISVVTLVGLGALIYQYYRTRKNKRDSWNPKNSPQRQYPSGLKNTGQFCYMNSMIQALASAETFIRQLEDIPNNPVLSNRLKGLLDLLGRVNNSHSDVNDSTAKLANLIDDVGWIKPSQQDTFDLLSAIINKIQSDFKKNNIQIQMPLKIKLLHTFNGIDFPNKAQDHLGLSLGLYGEYSRPPGVRLVDLIKGHFTPTFIDNDPNATTQMVFYKEAPDVLLLHMQANKWDEILGEMYKPVYHIIYGKDLILDMDIATDEMNLEIRHETGIKYQLCALVHHIGNIYGGHYITYRKWGGHWYLVSDEQVTEVEFRNDVCPYIMIYEKLDHLLDVD